MGIAFKEIGRAKKASESFPELAVLLQRIKDVYAPLYIILYGSRARGEATVDSDWDISIVIKDNSPESLFSPLTGWQVQHGSGVYADLSCARLSDFRDDLNVANSAAREIVKDGIVLECD